jgi:hypothetical protein
MARKAETYRPRRASKVWNQTEEHPYGCGLSPPQRPMYNVRDWAPPPGEEEEFRMLSEGSARKADWIGRGVGLAVFVGGILLLVVVFIWTNQLGEALPKEGAELTVADYIRFGVTVVKLFISGLVASWISGRGAQMYAAASRALQGE